MRSDPSSPGGEEATESLHEPDVPICAHLIENSAALPWFVGALSRFGR